MKKRRPDLIDFPGFAEEYGSNPGSGSFLKYPLILEEYWWVMSGAEQKCLTFIIRQTIGWGKTCDAISWAQFANGIGGKSKGKGTGLSVSQIRRAVAGLEKKGFIAIHRRKTQPCIFHLVLEKGKMDMEWGTKHRDIANSLIEDDDGLDEDNMEF